MYHRFEENKYPSTNIKIDIFKKHLDIIKNSKFEFYHPKDFENDFNKPKKKKILVTIDDAFKSFMKSLANIKRNKIPFYYLYQQNQLEKRIYDLGSNQRD